MGVQGRPQRPQGEPRFRVVGPKQIENPIDWSLNMKTIKMQVFATVTAIAVVFVLSLSAHAQNASETLYKSKCAACHGADGTGSATGKKMGAHDFTTVDVQGMSDAELA